MDQVQTRSVEKGMLESEGGSSSDKIRRKGHARVRSQFKYRQDSEKKARSSPKVVQVQTRSEEKGRHESEVSSSSDKIRKKGTLESEGGSSSDKIEEKGMLESEGGSSSDKICRKGHAGVRRWSKFRQDPKKKACWSPKSVQVQTRFGEKCTLKSEVSSTSDRIRRKRHARVQRGTEIKLPTSNSSQML